MVNKVKEVNIILLIEKETGQKCNEHHKLPECPFCRSGAGINKTPAFSINTVNNYFKCFACERKGTTIDFIMYLHEDWDEKKAIHYINDNYLFTKPAKNIDPPTLDPVQKTILAIKNNPIDKATEYLKQRKINTSQLPKGSYWYDSVYDAVVFLDSEEKLINRRIIHPKNGNPKANNLGKVTESIYIDTYKKDFDTVFLHEGVLNAISMLKFSAISTFSSTNLLKNPIKLLKYIIRKHIVLAFDNDSAGNKCCEYYTDFLISNRFDIPSIRKLIFPKNKDANDLLCEGTLDMFLKDDKNYELLWEDIVTKPIPTDSEDIRLDNDEYLFYKEKGCYYTRETIKGKPSIKKLSNFLMDIIYHLMDGTKDSRRLIKFQRNTGEITVSEIFSNELKLDKFKSIIRSISSKGLTFFGNTQHLEYILNYQFDREQNAQAIAELGYQPEYKNYCFCP